MTIKVNPDICPKCDAKIPSDAPQGLCPKCVLLGAASTEPGPSPSATAEVPARERVAAAFPQLEILELLGRGGMGFVFKARQPHLDRFVALKLLPDKLARDAHFAERFSREARMLARLNHPGIVTIYDFGQAGGFYFLLMEFVDGVNMRQAMQAGRFSPAAALAVVPKICEALQFAHEQGVLHRDIKPENILLDAKGRVKIADFGIAKLVGDEKPDLNLTATGATIGTPQYMAPEQLEQPGTVDHRADIYSLGVVFYEMLTGELPIGRFSPPSQRTPLDPRVDEVVMRTLEKEREKRYQSAREVKTNVEHLTEPQGVSAVVTPAFDASQDFILCPPRLPRMAKAIIGYALVIAPLLWVISLFTFEALPKHELAAFLEGTFNVVSTVGDFLLLVLLTIGGWRLRGLKPSAPGWLKVALWLHLIFLVLAMAGQVWVVMAVDELVPDAPAPALNLGDGVMVALILAAVAFEISALVWLHRHGASLNALCQPPSLGQGPHGTAVLGTTGVDVSKWSRAAIVGAALTGLSLPLPVLLLALMVTGMGGLGLGEIVLMLVAVALIGLPGTILGWISLSDIRAHRGQLRGLPLALFAALAWPVGLLVAGAIAVPWCLTIQVTPTTTSRLGSLLVLLIPAGAVTFAVWAVYSVARWGANSPPAVRRGNLKWIFVALLLALLGNANARWPQTRPTTRSLPSQASAPEVTLAVSAPPRETFIIKGIVLSNGVPLPGEPLRAKIWPASGLKPSSFLVQWKLAADASPDGAPWEIVVEDATANTIAARLRPPQLPQLDWTVSPSTANLGKLSVTREARTFEIARALQMSDGVPTRAVDWSVRIQLQSSPHSTASSRGIKADFVLPANQVAAFELVTRSNGVILPLPDLAAYHINGTPETYKGKFILADDPDDLDSLTGLPRWTLSILGPDGRLTSQGLAVPPVPSDFNFTMELWKALQPDQEFVEGLPDSTSGRQPYGLRIRTQPVKLKSGLLHSSSGYGTNWMPAVARQLESAPTSPAAWMQFTFTAVELRAVAGQRWLAIDYLDKVNGDCQKAFPWEANIPGHRPETRTSEFAVDVADPLAARHQRIEYRLPDSIPHEQLEQLRSNVEKALKQKTIRLELGEQKSLFEFGNSSDTALKAWIKVIPPSNNSP